MYVILSRGLTMVSVKAKVPTSCGGITRVSYTVVRSVCLPSNLSTTNTYLVPYIPDTVFPLFFAFSYIQFFPGV